MTKILDVVIIGSGFGGSIAAYRLARQGIKAVVLERGKRWPISPLGDTFSEYRKPDGRSAWLSDQTTIFEPKKIKKYVGLVEAHIEDGITVWSASGVGGGSLVYNTCLLQPSKENFETCFPGIDYDEMDKEYFPRVLRTMGAGPIPDDILSKPEYLAARIFQQLSIEANLETNRINVASDWNVVRDELNGKAKPSAIAGEIWYGSNSGYKNSLDKNYLKYAEDTGNTFVKPLSDVIDIKEADHGFTITYNSITETGEIIQTNVIKTKNLFLAAGSMGSTKLLVEAKFKNNLRKLNDDVGRYWGNNGDTFAVYSPGIKTNGDFGGPAHIVGKDYKDNPYGPQTLIAFPEWDSPQNTITFLGMSIPKDNGYWTYDTEKEKAVLHWPSTSENANNLIKGMEHTLAKFDSLRDSNDMSIEGKGFKGHYACPINLKKKDGALTGGVLRAGLKTEAASGVTAHPCGGISMGYAADEFGCVKGYDNLFVVDGSFIPRGTAAANPALTIAAFAERSMDKILKLKNFG